MPLGFSRVYVHLDEPFDFDAWMKGLAAGRSFVTTGPMLLCRVDDRWPGEIFRVLDSSREYILTCTVLSEQPLQALELIVNGRVAGRFEPANSKTESGAWESRVTTRFKPETSSWLAWRCFENRPGNRIRFAHTGPWHFEMAGKPLRPRRVEAEWLVENVKAEINRSRGIVPDGLISDYRRALEIYEAIAARSE